LRRSGVLLAASAAFFEKVISFYVRIVPIVSESVLFAICAGVVLLFSIPVVMEDVVASWANGIEE